MNLGGLAFRVCMYLTARPMATLTTDEIADRFCYSDRDKVAPRLLPAVDAGYLVASGTMGRGHRRVYSIGPRLKRVLEGSPSC